MLWKISFNYLGYFEVPKLKIIQLFFHLASINKAVAVGGETYKPVLVI